MKIDKVNELIEQIKMLEMIRKIIFISIAFFAFQQMNAQSFKEALDKAYTNILQDQNLKLKVEMTAYKMNNKSEILDRGEMIFINDEAGYYLKMLDMEVICENSRGIKVDHFNKQIMLFKMDESDLNNEDLGFHKFLEVFDEDESIFQMTKTEDSESSTYQASRNGLKELEITFKKGRIKKVIQYPQQKVEYRGKTLQTVLVLDYFYSEPSAKRLHQNEFLDIDNSSVNLNSRYKDYQLKDLRSL